MIRIAITAEAFRAITATRPLGTVAVEPKVDEKGKRLIWLEPAPGGGFYLWLTPFLADRLAAWRGPGESYSDVILGLEP